MFTDSEGLSNSLPEIANSLRFNAANSTYGTWTPGVAGNRQKFTISVWVKRSKLGATQSILTVNSANPQTSLYFANADTLTFFNYTTGATYDWYLETARVFRDPSAWLHIVCAVDTTQATQANRVKIYVNGVQESSWSSVNVPQLVSQNFNATFNNTLVHAIGKDPSGSQYLDGYEANFIEIDGQQLDPTSFGYTDPNGQWRTKTKAALQTLVNAAGGLSRFYAFDNVTSTTTLGYDASTLSNHMTLTNMVRDGSVNDCSSYDTPTNNFATLTALKYVGTAPSNGGLDLSSSGSNACHASQPVLTGTKGVVEFSTPSSTSSTACAVGVRPMASQLTGLADGNSYSTTYYRNDGALYENGSQVATYSSWSGSAATIRVEVDCVNNQASWYLNNTLQGTRSLLASGVDYSVYPVTNGSGAVLSANFGQRPVSGGAFDSASGGYFKNTPTSGFKALNRKNLPDPAITFPNKHFDAALWNGTGATQTINDSLLNNDLAWIKCRSTNYLHNIVDMVRGVNGYLDSDGTTAEWTITDKVTAMGAGSLTLGADSSSSNGAVNKSGQSYVGWLFNMGGSTVTNNAGSISSQVRANALAGMSVVSWTPATSADTVGHGLSSAPKMIIAKQRNTGPWVVYHSGLTSAAYYLSLNTTAAQATGSEWNSTNPTSTVFLTGSYFNGNGPTIAYCFTEIPGFSKIGSYTGNGSTDGPMVVTGFRPRLVMVKRTDTTGNWVIQDSARSTYNQSQANLYANLSNAEDTTTTYFDLLSNGFKSRNVEANTNQSGGTFVYIAFAETPFKFSNGR